jgi:FixJ family two-component response regulator
VTTPGRESRVPEIPDHSCMTTKRNVIAVVDDHLGVLGAIGRLLSTLGYRTELYASAQEFLDAAMTSEAICLILDIELGETSGIELAQHLAIAKFNIPVIFMTASTNESVQKRAREVGCIDFLIKPFTSDALIEALTNLSPRS